MRVRSVTRRWAVTGLAAAAGAAAVPFFARTGSASPGYTFSGPAADRGLGLAPPKPCTPGTRSQTAGPFYTPQTPQRDTLREPDTGGEPLVFKGLVLAHDCRPLAGAVIDVWHCDEHGYYDNRSFRYRGHQFTDAAGAFRIETIRPGHYTGRTPHIHVKVQGEGDPPAHHPGLFCRHAGEERPRLDISGRPRHAARPCRRRLARALRLRARAGLRVRSDRGHRRIPPLDAAVQTEQADDRAAHGAEEP